MNPNALPYVPEESDAEQAERHYERTIRDLRERLAARNAVAVELGAHLERVLEAFEPLADSTHAKTIARARRALGLPYDADDAEEYGDGGAF